MFQFWQKSVLEYQAHFTQYTPLLVCKSNNHEINKWNHKHGKQQYPTYLPWRKWHESTMEKNLKSEEWCMPMKTNSVKWLCYKEKCAQPRKYFRYLHKTNSIIFTIRPVKFHLFSTINTEVIVCQMLSRQTKSWIYSINI